MRDITVIHGNYSNDQGTHYVNGLVRKGDDENIVGKFYINIPRRDTNLVVNFTPGENQSYSYPESDILMKQHRTNI